MPVEIPEGLRALRPGPRAWRAWRDWLDAHPEVSPTAVRAALADWPDELLVADDVDALDGAPRWWRFARQTRRFVLSNILFLQTRFRKYKIERCSLNYIPQSSPVCPSRHCAVNNFCLLVSVLVLVYSCAL